MTEKEVHSRKVKVSGKFLPLSVYERQGYDVQKIKEKGEMQKSDIFGEVFRVPTLEVSHAHVEEEVRTRMLQATRSLGKRKASKRTTRRRRRRMKRMLKTWLRTGSRSVPTKETKKQREEKAHAISARNQLQSLR